MEKIGMEGIEVKTEGSWTWVYGKTYEIKEALKAQGLKWSGKRKAWYIREVKDIKIDAKEHNGGAKTKEEINAVVLTEKIPTPAEWATKVKEGVFKGIQTGTLYDKTGGILTKTTKLLTTADTKDTVIKTGIGKAFHKYEGRRITLIKLGSDKIDKYKIIIAEGGRMTLEKVKYYKTKAQAEMQYGYIVGKNTERELYIATKTIGY
jgi:hypothetical protein